MDKILSMADFIAEQFNLSGFVDNVKQKTKVDITKFVDTDDTTGMILISIPMTEDGITLSDMKSIENLAKKYGKYYKGIHHTKEANKIFIKFMSK